MKAGQQVLEIRPMGAGDLAQVMALAETLPEAPHWPRAAYLKALDPESTPRRVAVVAGGPGPEIRGFAMASLLTPQAELETIAVARECQRQGVGKYLLRALVDRLASAGANELLLEVRASNRSALAFYRTFGFVEAGLRRGYYQDPVEDAIQMRLVPAQFRSRFQEA